MTPPLTDIIQALVSGKCNAKQALNWLKIYQEQTKEIQHDLDLLPIPTVERETTVLSVVKKIYEQEQQWCLSKYPNFDIELISAADTDASTLSGYYKIPTPNNAKLTRIKNSEFGELAWFDILLSEVCNLTNHHNESNKESLRLQLIDAAAVAILWAETLTAVTISEPLDPVSEEDLRFGQPHYGHGRDSEGQDSM
jgi:hypothetical protein